MMDISLNKNEYKSHDVDFDVLLNKILSGKAVLFTGAGFSMSGVNVNGKNLMSGKSLAKKLCLLAGTKESENLRFASDYFIDKMGEASLVDILLNEFKVKSLSESQRYISSLNWRRCYTTNYDLAFENSAILEGNNVQCVDIGCDVKDYYKRGKLCVHLNGSINSLTEDSLNNTFKLSDSSYCSPDSFINSEWYYYFKKDTDFANAIVFIGYSLYDIEIKSILHQTADLKDKTYFITSAYEDDETLYTLNKYGTVIPIGLDGFVDRLKACSSSLQEKNEYIFTCFSEYEMDHVAVEIRDEQVEKMLMYGEIDDAYIDNYMMGNSKRPCLTTRDAVDEIKKSIFKNNIIITGALGNGKTILLKEIRSTLSSLPYTIYEVGDAEGDFIADVDYLGKLSQNSVILLDGYEQYLSIIKHIVKSDYGNITLILTARIADHEYHRSELDSFGFKYREINVDNLSEPELSSFVSIIDNLGLWGERAGLSHHQKVRELNGGNNGQLSIILLSMLNSPQIKEKIKDFVDELKKQKKYENTLIAACLCQIIGIPGTKSIISTIANDDMIYDNALLNNKNFKMLFKVSDGLVSSSSLLCVHLIKNNFSSSTISAFLIKVAAKFNKIESKNFEQDRIFKSMLKFSFVEQLMPDIMKRGSLQRYYEDLKIEVIWLTNNPHFWLQYAMSFLAFQNYPKAQQFLDQAYAIAHKKEGYHTDNIDTQQAKLLLLCCEKIPDGNKVYGNFVRANTLLRNLSVDIYMLRQVVRYKDFYEQNYSKLSKENKRNFLSSCKSMIRKIETQYNENTVGRYYYDTSLEVLNKITDSYD
ncbi:SIR2 family protein [Cronobacter sakazakii]|uniref:SIR2 family protein n=1 Tax=Cronobacter sakazakii TaxID=28141 RepID=UPI00155973DD|nr:SIR2 family protein [Cronobacter sakazakii]